MAGDFLRRLKEEGNGEQRQTQEQAGTARTSGGSSFLQRLKEERDSTTAQRSAAIRTGERQKEDDLYSSWLDSLSSFSSGYSRDYGARNGRYQDSAQLGSYRDSLSAQIDRLNSQANSLRGYYNTYGSVYDELYGGGTSKKLLDSISGGMDYLNSVRKSVNSEYDYWSQFADEDEYNRYLADREENERLSALDLDDARRRRETLRAQIDAISARANAYAKEHPAESEDYARGLFESSRDILDQYNELGGDIEKAERVQRRNGYGTLVNNADFAEGSAYREGVDDDLYNYINGDAEAGARLSSRAMGLYDPTGTNPFAAMYAANAEDRREARQLTDEERGIYNYLYNSEGRSAAQDYYDFMQSDLNARQRYYDEMAAAQEATKSGWSAFKSSAGTVLSAPLRTITLAGQLADYAATGKIDQNAGYNRFSYTNTATRSAVAGDIKEKVTEKAGEWVGDKAASLYLLGMSYLDSRFNALISGGFGGMIPVKDVEAVSLSLMGAEAAADSMIEAKDRGLEDGQALALGLVSGAAEILTERYSLETLLDPDRLLDSGWKYLIKNAAAEGSEEAASNIINFIADIVITKDESEWRKSVEQYMKEHPDWTEGHAVAAALGDQAMSVLGDAAGGALMGIFGAGGQLAVDAYGNFAEGRRLGSYNMSPGNVMSITDYIAEGLSLDESTYAHRLAERMQEKLDAGETVSQYEMGRLANAVGNAGTAERAVMPEAADAIDTEGSRVLSEEKQELPSDGPVTAKGTLDTAATPVDNNINAEERNVRSEKSTGLSIDERQAAIRARQEAVQERAARFNEAYDDYQQNGYTAEQYEALKEESNAIDREIQDIRKEMEALSNEARENHLRESGERADGEDTGEQVRGVEQGTGRDPGGEAKGRSADREAVNLTYGKEVSTGSLGIGRGSTTDRVRLVTGGETAAIREARRIAKERGLRLVLFGGDNLTIGGESVRGYLTGDRVFVRADHPEFTAAQLMRHEAGHDMIRKGEVNADEVRDRISRIAGENRTESVAQNYADAYAGTDLVADEIWEEIICDSLGDMNIFSTFSALGETTGKYLKTLKEVTQSSRKAAAEIRTATDDGGGKMSREKYQDYNKPINSSDIEELQAIGRKSVNSFSSSDVQKAQKWANKFYSEMGTKSPFFRAWFGDWRENDSSIVLIADIPAYTDSNDARRKNRGTFRNGDTGWDVRVSRAGETNTISHAGIRRQSEYGLAGIQTLVRNAVLLDSEVHEHHTNDPKKDMIAFDHKLYALGKREDSIGLYRVTVEESYHDAKHTNDRSFHNLKYIEKVATVGGRSADSNLPGVSTSDNIATEFSVADLYALVKQYEKDFSPKPASAIVNEDGTPKVVYHGTDADFTVFDRTKGRSTMDIQGSFFSPWELDAEGYGEKVQAYYLNIKNPAPEGTAYRALNRFKGQNNAGVKAREYLESLGYDGVNNSDEEYIAFYPEQIKSAENNVGTFDRNNPDVRFSQEGGDELKELQAENKRLRERVEYFKGQMRQTARTDRTKLAEVWSKDINRFARDIRKEYSTTVKAEDIAGDMKVLAEYLMNGEKEDGQVVYGRAREMATMLASKIVNGSETLANEEDARQYGDLRRLTMRKMSISRQDASDVTDFNEWRKRQFGKINIGIDNGGLPVDTAYQELSGMMPGLFPEDISHPADQLYRMAEVLDSLRPIYENPYSLNMAYAIEYCANGILDELMSENIRQLPATFADKQAMAQEAQWERARAKYGKIYEEMVKREAAKRLEQVKEVREHYLTANRNAMLRKADSEQRQRLLKIAQRLKNRKLPAATRELLDQYIGELDTVAVRLTGKKTAELDSMRRWYEERKLTDPDFISDPRIEASLRRLSDRKIGDMTQAEVADLTEILLNIENELRTEKKLIDEQDQRDTYLMGLDIIRDVDESKGSRPDGLSGTLDKLIVTETLSPLREMHRVTGYVETDPLYRATQSLADGQRKMFDYQMRAEMQFSKFTNDKKFMESITGKNAQTVKLPVKGGALDITPAMRMSLYLHSKNDQNLLHIKVGGITIPDMKLYRQGKIAEAYARGNTVKLTPSEVRNVVSKMSAKERAFADAASKYFNTMSRDAINETSEKLKGYSLAGVEHYFPINTDTSFTKSEFGSVKFDGTVEGMGFLKERINGANPIMLRDMNDVLLQSVGQHARYYGLAIPIRNFNKLWGVTKASIDDDGNRTAYESSVMQTIKKNWGDSGYKYIEKMMADIQGVGKQQTSWGKALGKVRSSYAGAVLTLNASVAMKQAASYPTAGAVVGFKPLAKALAAPGKVDLGLIEKYTPLLWYRSQGFSTQELGDLKKQDKQLPKLLNWIQGVDVLTTRKLWKAAEFYIRDTQKSLKAGTDEYYRAVADVYNQIIEETQPNYTTMQRPQLLRSEDTLMQSLSMFKTQPFQNFNILYDALGNLDAKKRAYTNTRSAEAKAEYRAAQKRAAWAVTSQIAQLAVFSGMTLAWNAFRGKWKKYEDEDGEVALGSVLAGVGKDMLSGAASVVPFGSDAYELFSSAVLKETYYGFDDVTASAIDDLANAFLKSGKALGDVWESVSQGEEVKWNELRLKADSIADAATKVVGVPYENVVNLFNAVFRWGALGVGGEYLGQYAYLRLTASPSGSSGDYYDLLYKAYKAGDGTYETLYRKMLESGDFAENKIKSAMETRMKKAEGVKSISDLSERYLAPDQQTVYDAAADELERSALWRKASSDQRDAAEDKLYHLVADTSDSSAGVKMREKIDEGAAVGITETEYILYQLALSMADKPSESGKLGSYTNDEVEEAIGMLPGLSDEERAWLWLAQGKSEKSNPWE